MYDRFELLTLELEVESDNCVHDRLTIMGGKEMSGAVCGDRSGEVIIMEVNKGKDITVAVQVQSEEWRWNVGITQVSISLKFCHMRNWNFQISCQEVEDSRKRVIEMNAEVECGKKNPSM